MNLPTKARHRPGAILELADAHTRRGQYSEALDVLKGADAALSAEHPEYWLGMVCVASARNKLHMQDDKGAADFLGLISKSLRAANPKIDAECQTVTGILCRRAAHRLWKNGNSEQALPKIHNAVAAFDLAERSAQIALEERLQHNAVLNRLYAQGLLFAVQGKAMNNSGLLVEAVVAEARSRQSTPPNVKDDLAGLIIVADLAMGAHIALDQVRSLSDKAEFLSSWNIINSNRSTSWPELILNHVRSTSICKPDVLARALLLGIKMLKRADHEADGLLIGYAVQLHICYLSLKDMPLQGGLAGRVKEAVFGFPPHIAELIMAPTFLK